MGIETEEHKLMKEIVIEELKRLGYSDLIYPQKKLSKMLILGNF